MGRPPLKAAPDLAHVGVDLDSTTQVFPNGDAAYDVAHGVCAADLQAWGTPDASSPWGFTWVSQPDVTSLERMATSGGVNPVDPLTVCSDAGSYLCSRAFFVNCDQADTTGKQLRLSAVRRYAGTPARCTPRAFLAPCGRLTGL